MIKVYFKIEDVGEVHLFNVLCSNLDVEEVKQAITGERDYNHSEFDFGKINYKGDIMTAFDIIILAIWLGIVYGFYEFLKALKKTDKLEKELFTTTSTTNIDLHEIKLNGDGNMSVDFRKSCFEVQYCDRSTTCYIRLVYKANKKVFMHSESYFNKAFALKKAKQLAEELNTEVVHINERDK